MSSSITVPFSGCPYTRTCTEPRQCQTHAESSGTYLWYSQPQRNDSVSHVKCGGLSTVNCSGFSWLISAAKESRVYRISASSKSWNFYLGTVRPKTRLFLMPTVSWEIPRSHYIVKDLSRIFLGRQTLVYPWSPLRILCSQLRWTISNIRWPWRKYTSYLRPR